MNKNKSHQVVYTVNPAERFILFFLKLAGIVFAAFVAFLAFILIYVALTQGPEKAVECALSWVSEMDQTATEQKE